MVPEQVDQMTENSLQNKLCNQKFSSKVPSESKTPMMTNPASKPMIARASKSKDRKLNKTQISLNKTESNSSFLPGGMKEGLARQEYMVLLGKARCVPQDH